MRDLQGLQIPHSAFGHSLPEGEGPLPRPSSLSLAQGKDDSEFAVSMKPACTILQGTLVCQRPARGKGCAQQIKLGSSDFLAILNGGHRRTRSRHDRESLRAATAASVPPAA